MRGRRRLLIAALVAASLLLTGLAVAAYRTLVAPPGDVSGPTVEFVATPEPTPTPEPERRSRRRAADRFIWPRYGYTLDHRRVFDTRARLRGPWRRLWKRKASALLEFPPVIAGGALYQLADDGQLKAIRIRGGRVLWRKDLGHLAASSPAVDGPWLYVSLLETAKRSGRGRVASVRRRDGAIRWSRTLPSRSESSPLLHEGRVYVGSEDGTVYALQASTGRIIWRYRAAGAVKGSPTLANGLLYFGDYGGRVQAIRASNGRRVWSNDAARALLRGGEYYATAAVAYGRVYIGSTDGREYSFSARTGRLAWAHQTGRYVYSSAAVDTVPGLGPTVFFGSYDGTFYALDARSGAVRWRYRSGGKISGSPTIIGDTVYFADLGRSLTIGLSTRTGRRLERWEQGGYDPVVSDGRHLFLTGRYSLTALVPRSARR